jgi:hypothetical protein
MVSEYDNRHAERPVSHPGRASQSGVAVLPETWLSEIGYPYPVAGKGGQGLPIENTISTGLWWSTSVLERQR